MYVQYFGENLLYRKSDKHIRNMQISRSCMAQGNKTYST